MGDDVNQDLVEYNGFQIPKALKDQINGRVIAEKSTLKKELEEQLTEIVKEKERISAELKEIKLASMSDKEKAELEKKETAERLSKLEQEKEGNYNLFKTHKTTTDIYSALSKYDVYNPKQVLALLTTTGHADVVKDGNEFKSVFKWNNKDYSIDDAVKEFLEAPENANLLRNKLTPGADTQQNRASTSTGNKVFKQSEILNNPEVKREFNALLAQGIVPEIKE